MRTKRIERLLRLIQTLELRRSLTVEELAGPLHVSRRTVFRDLQLLAKAGLDYSYSRDTKQYTAERSMLLPPVTLTHAEALALLLSVKAVGQRGDLTDRATANTACLKLESMLPASLRDYVGPLMDWVEMRPSPSSDVTSITTTLRVIQSACRAERKLWARYDSYYERAVIDVTLRPYRLAYVHRGWYLIAMTEGMNKVRTYKVERIVRLRVLDEAYVPDPSFSLDEYFGNAWLMIRGDRRFHVKIKFLPRVASNVDEIVWHKSQQTFREPDESLIFEVDVDGIEEISWWVLGYGDQAQVFEPPELRDLVAQHARAMHAYYADEHDPAGHVEA